MVTHVIRVAAGGVFVAFLAVFVYAWMNAPEVVPTHFDLAGEPDAWGSRNVMWWTLLGTGLAGAATFALSFFPRLYNLPFPITPENRDRQYAIAQTLVSYLSLSVLVMGLLITLAQLQEDPQPYIRGVTWVSGSMLLAVGGFLTAAWRAR